MKRNEIVLRLGIWGFDDITHDEITEKLGIQPCKVYIKGQRKNSIGSAIAEENGWLMNSSLDKYSSFEDQMDSLLSILESKVDTFKVICEKYYCEISCALYIYRDNEEGTPWIHLNKRYNKLIKELNIDFDIDIYCM